MGGLVSAAGDQGRGEGGNPPGSCARRALEGDGPSDEARRAARHGVPAVNSRGLSAGAAAAALLLLQPLLLYD